VYATSVFSVEGVYYHPEVQRRVAERHAIATGDDFNVPSGNDAMAEWNRLGYSADLLISACLEIIDATMTAFPNQDVRMSFDNVAPRLGWPADYVTTDVIGRAREVWGERLIAMRHTLSAATPDPRSGQRQGIWEDILAAAPAVAGQMLWPATDVTTCRMNGGASCRARSQAPSSQATSSTAFSSSSKRSQRSFSCSAELGTDW